MAFAALVLFSFAAFAITQRLKHTPTVVQRFMHTPYFSPTPQGHNKQERISLMIAKADRVTVTVLDEQGKEVATLIKALPLPRYRRLSLHWNGRRGSSPARVHSDATGLTVQASETGQPAPQGEYHVRVQLLSQKRTVESPWSFRLVRHPHTRNGS